MSAPDKGVCVMLNPLYLRFDVGDWGEGETAPSFSRNVQTSLLCLLCCVLASQMHREHPHFIPARGYMEAEEFQAPAAFLFCFTTTAVTVQTAEFSVVRVSTSQQLGLEQPGCSV